MKNLYILAVLFFLGGVFSVSAQDLIVLKTGNMIEGKVMEISPTEIRYKRADHLDGPTIVLSANTVLSIRYQNGRTDIINGNTPSGTTGATTAPGGTAGNSSVQQPGSPSSLQAILNTMPAIRIAGNNLKFDFSGETWTAKVNGENFSAGTIESEMTGSGAILTLKQTHIWPGAVGKTAGRLANRIPGGAAAAGALNTAGSIAGAVGPIETSGSEMVLEYKAGPPASLKLVSTRKTAEASAKQNTPGTARNTDNAVIWQENGHSYLIVDKKLSWTSAKLEAEHRGGYLAIITSVEEQEFIMGLLSRNGNRSFYWLGGYREGGNWQWLTGETFSFRNWSRGKPDNYKGEEDKLVILRKPAWGGGMGQWEDLNKGFVDNGLGYIIEWDAQ